MSPSKLKQLASMEISMQGLPAQNSFAALNAKRETSSVLPLPQGGVRPGRGSVAQ